MITKEELKAYIQLTKEIESLEEMIKRLQLKKDNIKATRPSFQSGAASSDKMAGNLAKLDELLVLYHEKLEQWLILQKKITEAVEELPEPEKTVVYYRYLMGLEWVEVASRLHYSWQWTHKLHARALNILAEQ